jgi:dihydrofolate reductase
MGRLQTNIIRKVDNRMGFSIIVAHDEALGIGKNNKIPWYIKEDLQHFKELTIHGVVIMGRKTWESLPKAVRPLPLRENVIISKTLYEQLDTEPHSNQKLTQIASNSESNTENPFKCFDLSQECIHIEPSFESAIQKWAEQNSKRVFVIGGSSIYKQAIQSELCESLIITKVKGIYDCDTFFPDYSNWKLKRMVKTGDNYTINEFQR